VNVYSVENPNTILRSSIEEFSIDSLVDA